MPFIDRDHAGQQLATRVASLALVDPVVLSLPRGGVPVGSRVAEELDAPLDVIVVRKLGVPFQPELAMGAIGEDAIRVLDAEVVAACGVSEREIRSAEIRERVELEKRASRYRSDHVRIPLPGRTAVVVDDGMATGSSARAACLVARAHGAARVVVAVPVASRHSVATVNDVADDVVVLEMPEPFYAVGQWYLRFDQTSDQDVVELLARARRRQRRTLAPERTADLDEGTPGSGESVLSEVEIPVGGVRLFGKLAVPEYARAVVVFAHGSGSGRHSPRNRYVADTLNHAGLATLLFDLLTLDEEQQRANVFDVGLLGSRLVGVTAWLVGRPDVKGLPIGYFGASTGAAAALWAAAHGTTPVFAVVSRGGRPDLAGPSLAETTTPTLLIVGGRDVDVLELNRQAESAMVAEVRLVEVPEATHLFSEPGTLECVAALAEHWFTGHLPSPGRTDREAGRAI